MRCWWRGTPQVKELAVGPDECLADNAVMERGSSGTVSGGPDCTVCVPATHQAVRGDVILSVGEIRPGVMVARTLDESEFDAPLPSW